MMEHEQRLPPAGENSTAIKRVADEELIKDDVKRPRPSDTRTDLARSNQPGISMAFPNGALRITRTPGRRNAKNCVNLTDVIDKEQLVSACVFSFFIADEELFQHLPLSRSSHTVPVSNDLQHMRYQATSADFIVRFTLAEIQIWILWSPRSVVELASR